MDRDNRKRALAEVVSLDAWHKGFTKTRKTAALHVDVAFSTGRIGGEEDSSVRFRLSLKRAEVVVIVPPTEPAKVDKASVSRDAPRVAIEATETRRSKSEGRVGGRLYGSAGKSGTSAGARADASMSASQSKEMAIQISRDLSAFSITQIQTADGDYAWAIEPTAADVLDGRPWDAARCPRLNVTDERPDRARGIEPNIRVEIRCKREDMEIKDIVLKDRKAFAALTKGPFGRNKMLAAEAVIRTRLFEAGLLSGNVDDPFSQITLCATIAESQ